MRTLAEESLLRHHDNGVIAGRLLLRLDFATVLLALEALCGNILRSSHGRLEELLEVQNRSRDRSRGEVTKLNKTDSPLRLAPTNSINSFNSNFLTSSWVLLFSTYISLIPQ